MRSSIFDFLKSGLLFCFGCCWAQCCRGESSSVCRDREPVRQHSRYAGAYADTKQLLGKIEALTHLTNHNSSSNQRGGGKYKYKKRKRERAIAYMEKHL